ncbi:hypothetical protein AGMMS49975_03190 [Clostridia bacterium]|nr:hypothetical protein AGMMS49975_03190 [Clostridia bacterium]
MLKSVYKFFAIIGLVVLFFLSSCAANSSLQLRSKVSDDEAKRQIVGYLKEKYDKDFEITFTNPMSFKYCQYKFEAESIPEKDFVYISASLYKNGKIACNDDYFAYLIRDDYGKYISDVIAEVYPENKVIAYSLGYKFNGFDKNSTFKDALENYQQIHSAFQLTIYINEENSRERKMKISNEIAQQLYISGFSDSAYVYCVRNEENKGYQTLKRGIGTKEQMDLLEWTGLIVMFRKNDLPYKLVGFYDVIDGEMIKENMR